MGRVGGDGGDELAVGKEEEEENHLYNKMRKMRNMVMEKRRCNEEDSFSSNMFDAISIFFFFDKCDICILCM